jgi:hypothetical protein
MRDALFSALNGKQPTMSAHGSRTQITLFGRSTGRLTGDRVAAPNGGSARGYHEPRTSLTV